MAERTIGKITHYFGRIGVAALSLSEPLRIGDRIHVKGHTTDVTMTVERMQIEHRDVSEAKLGDDVAIHVTGKVREHDEVLRVEP